MSKLEKRFYRALLLTYSGIMSNFPLATLPSMLTTAFLLMAASGIRHSHANGPIAMRKHFDISDDKGRFLQSHFRWLLRKSLRMSRSL